MKKVLITALAIFASTGILAKSENLKMIQASDATTAWSIDGDYSYGLFVDNMAKKPKVVIFYVNSNRNSNPALASDPILIDCNGVPTMLNPGLSAVCNINAQRSNIITWGVDERYKRNGADGYTIIF